MEAWMRSRAWSSRRQLSAVAQWETHWSSAWRRSSIEGFGGARLDDRPRNVLNLLKVHSFSNMEEGVVVPDSPRIPTLSPVMGAFRATGSKTACPTKWKRPAGDRRPFARLRRTRLSDVSGSDARPRRPCCLCRRRPYRASCEAAACWDPCRPPCGDSRSWPADSSLR